MKKQLILILTLVLLVGVTAGILLIVNNMETEQKAEKERLEQEKILVSLNSNDIDRIELLSDGEEYIAVLDENGKWTLENEVDFEINTYYLNSLASQLSTLTADEVICPVDGANLSDYGLDAPTTITLCADETTYIINVGELSATGEFYYVTIDGRDKVFGVSADYADFLNANKSSLKSIYILRNSDSPVTAVSLEAHGEIVYDLTMNEDKLWLLNEPVALTDRVDTSGVNTLLTNISQMIVDRFGEEYVTEDQYAELGFDDPAYIFRFQQENGETTTLLVQDYDLESTSFVSLLCKETGQAFQMESTYTDFLHDEPDQFIQNIIYSCPISEIESIKIDWTEREKADIYIDEENGKYELNGTALDGNEEAVIALENFYTKIQALKYDVLIPENPTEADAEPEITITYTKMDGTSTEITFCEADEENLAVFADGEYSYFTISKKNFTARDGIYDYYDQLLNAAGIEK
ncbi:MAG: DUF4340 domain-containing protein [Ruminococcus sp.]|nr:DUF4340 domain-containing protein [Ruminococcus sp.]